MPAPPLKLIAVDPNAEQNREPRVSTIHRKDGSILPPEQIDAEGNVFQPPAYFPTDPIEDPGPVVIVDPTPDPLNIPEDEDSHIQTITLGPDLDPIEPKPDPVLKQAPEVGELVVTKPIEDNAIDLQQLGVALSIALSNAAGEVNAQGSTARAFQAVYGEMFEVILPSLPDGLRSRIFSLSPEDGTITGAMVQELKKISEELAQELLDSLPDVTVTIPSRFTGETAEQQRQQLEDELEKSIDQQSGTSGILKAAGIGALAWLLLG